MTAESDIEPAIRLGWELTDTIDKSLLSYVVENGGLILKVVGGFDDHESGFVAFGEPNLIKKIV